MTILLRDVSQARPLVDDLYTSAGPRSTPEQQARGKRRMQMNGPRKSRADEVLRRYG